MMKVLMIGATGRFAGLVLPELKKRGITVYALVQDNQKADKALENGADKTVIGSLDDKQSLQKAAKGMDISIKATGLNNWVRKLCKWL